MKFSGVVVAASLALSCGGGPLPRETRAANARSDDPWLASGGCSPEMTDDAGLRFEEIEAGVGKPVEEGETVRVHYAVKSPDGRALHDSHDGGPPVEIIIGSTKVLCGFEKSLVGMRPGGQRRAFVPWHLAFGEGGREPDIQPRADLVFVIDLYLPADAVTQTGGPPVNPLSRGRRR